MANIHDDLFKEIMLWLPVKSLLRFRCVCKSLCAITDSKSFIYAHLKRCSEHQIHRKLIYFENGTIFHTFDINDGSKEKFLLSDDQLPPIMRPWFVSYCNGLVLLYISRQELSVWNPSTRDYRKLLVFPVKFSYNIPETWTFGLGYDSAADGYKVIVMISMGCSDSLEVWILGLKSSAWRKLEDFPFAEFNCVRIGGKGDCFVDCALHFICYKGDKKSHIVVAFDVTNETFSVIDLYRRKKEGIEFRWTKLYSVTVQQISEDSLPYIRSGKLLEYSDEQGKALFLYYGRLFSFDIREKSLKEIKIKNTNVLDYVVCFESLVPVEVE